MRESERETSFFFFFCSNSFPQTGKRRRRKEEQNVGQRRRNGLSWLASSLSIHVSLFDHAGEEEEKKNSEMSCSLSLSPSRLVSERAKPFRLTAFLLPSLPPFFFFLFLAPKGPKNDDDDDASGAKTRLAASSQQGRRVSTIYCSTVCV